MRVSFSHHTESIRTRASQVFSGHEYQNFRPILNIQAFCQLLQRQAFEDNVILEATPPRDKGKKRALSNPIQPTRSSKRIKLLQDTANDESEHKEQDSEQDFVKMDDIWWPDMRYPFLPQPSTLHNWNAGVARDVPVLQHTFEIQYADEHVPANKSKQWSPEEILSKILADLQTEEPRTIELGDIRFVKYAERLVVYPTSNPAQWLLLLPRHSEDINLDWFGIASPLVKDLMMAADLLQLNGRVRVKAQLKMIVLPSGTSDTTEHELPFRLQIETSVALRLPAIFEPLPRPSKQANTLYVEDAQRRLFQYLFPSPPGSVRGPINVSFFHSILPAAPPLPHSLPLKALQPSKLLPTLLPFQRRSLAWLLGREGKTIQSNSEVVPKPPSTEFSFWEKVEEGNDTWYINRLTGNLLPSLPDTVPALGAILAEEPGLGKTLESIALILMNPAPPERGPAMVRWDPEAQLDLKAIKSTLIVTPPALASQWASELALHAPSLKVMTYEGWSKVPVPITETQAARVQLSKKKLKLAQKAKKQKGKYKRSRFYESSDEDAMDTDSDEVDLKGTKDWASYAHEFDVVITTYAVLRADLNVARAVPQRPRRADVWYSNVDRARSPLVLVEWNRVIMDEVQMAGGGKTEDMVSLIPRVSSLAVSGTPARQQTSDLLHVLKFLRVDDLVGPARLWNRLISTDFGAPLFAALFQAYCIRTLKTNVKEELTIPQQSRYLVSITFGPVEKLVYDQALEALLQELGLDARGVAASDGWEIDGSALRSGLRKLRGLCTHPQVGQLQKTGDKLFKPGAVKSMDDVLQSMRETNWKLTMDNQRSRVQALIRVAQLQAHDENDENCFRHALNTLLDAEKYAVALVDETSAALNQYMLQKPQSKGPEDADSTRDSDKGKQRQASEEPLKDDSPENEDDSPLGETDAKKWQSGLQNRLRECRIVLHRAKFLQGDMYHALGADHSAEEDAAYSAAENIRRGLLKGTEDDALRVMELLTQDATTNQITNDALQTNTPVVEVPTLLAILEANQPTKAQFKAKPQLYKVTVFKRVQSFVDLVDEANRIIEEVLNEQSDLLWEWRSHITNLLTQKLASSEDQPDGEEYQRTLDNQGSAEVYLQSYSALLSDRRQGLLNERTLLAAHNVREKKKRRTKAAMNAANSAHLMPVQTLSDIEVQPEHQVLYSELQHQRQDLLDGLEGRAIKSVIVDLNAAAAGIKRDTDQEKIALKETASKLRQYMNDQVALMDRLDADLVLIRKAFNHRILYFKQLQEISDTVAEATWEGGIVEALLQAAVEKNELDAEINTSRARQRYLENLNKNGDTDIIEDEHCCILCRCEFVRGFITHCAHIFCEGCMKAWLLRKEGKTCPVCRVPVNPDTIQRFTVTPDKPEPEKLEKPEKRPVIGEQVPRSRREISYNMIDPTLFAELNSMESFGDYGSKIQTLVRHLLYIKNADPGAKSIVFSAWADSLRIIDQALKQNGIHCLRIDQGSKGKSAAQKFKDDPKLLVLLLHGERENAGLNITCASRVFLLESVVHHGFEIQAIARIDRMGQTRSTEVFCYYAEDTVERNILDLAAKKGLSLYTKENSAGTLNFSSFSAETDIKIDEAAKKKTQKTQKGDFIFKVNDMLAILFPHMFEELEYLIPPSDTGTEGFDLSQPTISNGELQEVSTASNAIAGPSRIEA